MMNISRGVNESNALSRSETFHLSQKIPATIFMVSNVMKLGKHVTEKSEDNLFLSDHSIIKSLQANNLSDV